MSKLTKQQKRKQKLKERFRQEERGKVERYDKLVSVFERFCKPIIPNYVDEAKDIDLEGHKIAYTIGLYAWNICVSGNVDLTRNALKESFYNQEQLDILENDIKDLIRSKYERFPNITVSILDVAAVLVDGVPHAKIHFGKTFPKMPPVEYVTQRESRVFTPEMIADLRRKLKLTQLKFGELFKITARKVSEWEHGKASPNEEQTAQLWKMTSPQ